MKAPLSDRVRRILRDPVGREKLYRAVARGERSIITIGNRTYAVEPVALAEQPIHAGPEDNLLED